MSFGIFESWSTHFDMSKDSSCSESTELSTSGHYFTKTIRKIASPYVAEAFSKDASGHVGVLVAENSTWDASV